jgi:hypothetical protein
MGLHGAPKGHTKNTNNVPKHLGHLVNSQPTNTSISQPTRALKINTKKQPNTQVLLGHAKQTYPPLAILFIYFLTMVTLFLKGEVKIVAFCTQEFDTFFVWKSSRRRRRRRRRGDDDDDEAMTTTTRR